MLRLFTICAELCRCQFFASDTFFLLLLNVHIFLITEADKSYNDRVIVLVLIVNGFSLVRVLLFFSVCQFQFGQVLVKMWVLVWFVWFMFDSIPISTLVVYLIPAKVMAMRFGRNYQYIAYYGMSVMLTDQKITP